MKKREEICVKINSYRTTYIIRDKIGSYFKFNVPIIS